MPKGTKIVDWTPENEAKLFHTIMAVHDIKVDNAKVAAAFGPNVPATCIVTKMSTMRKKATAMGIIPSPTPTTTTSRTTAAGDGKKGKKGNSNDGNGATVDDQEPTIKKEEGLTQHVTPPETSDEKAATATSIKNKTISGRVKKPRASPRKPAKKDYKKIEDPFLDMEDAKDENGVNVFGGNQDAVSEDSVVTGGEYETMTQDADVKVEDVDVKYEEA